MSCDIKDIKDKPQGDEYKEETWGKSIDGENITDGYKFRGKQHFKKAREELEKLMVRGAQFDVGNIELIVLDARNKGIELEIDIQMNDKDKENRGVAVVKLYGPNKRKENCVTITKSKQSDIKFVTLMAEKVIKPLIKKILGKEGGEIAKEPSNKNKCQFCEKTFKTIIGLRGHNTKMHKLDNDNSKETINSVDKNEDYEVETNLEEGLEIKEEKKYTYKCKLCQIYLETLRKYELIQKILKHNETCGMPNVKPIKKSGYCENCEFKASDELHLKRHRRDKHDLMSASTSPPTKKSKMSKIQMQEDMDIDDSRQEDMDVDNDENEEVIRSKIMDEKIKVKAKKVEEEERIYQEKKKKEEERKKELEVIEIEEKKRSVRKRKQKNKVENKKSRKTKDISSNIPNVKPVPKNVAHLCKQGDKVYTVPGDGACGANSIAAHLFRDEVFGPKLRQKINHFKVKHWNRKYKFKTQCSVESPFIRKIGQGGEISFTDPGKLFNYLKNDPMAGYMWTECEDLIIVADMFQVKIKVIRTKGDTDDKPFVAVFNPDEDMKEFAELKDVEIAEIVLLNENDVHFNLIISEDDELAKEGSLSFMNNIGPLFETKDPEETKTYVEAVVNGQKGKKETEDELEKLKKALKSEKERTKALEKQYDECEAALVKMTEEFEKQKSELYDLKQIIKLEKELNETPKQTPKKTFKIPSKDKKNSETNSEVNDMDLSFVEKEFNCMECDFQGTEQNQLNKHILIRHRMQCRNCESIFKTKPELMEHRKEEHYATIALCRKGIDCQFSEKCWWKHIKDHESMIECFYCELTFATKVEVMLHRKSHHAKTVKQCTKFMNKSCNRTEATCWFKHETRKELGNSNENVSVFQNRPNNYTNP